jgi:hypothetical protein
MRFLGLRSCGPIAVSSSIIGRFGLRLGGSSTGRAVAGTVVGSIIPFRQAFERIAVLDLVLARDQQNTAIGPQERKPRKRISL